MATTVITDRKWQNHTTKQDAPAFSIIIPYITNVYKINLKQPESSTEGNNTYEQPLYFKRICDGSLIWHQQKHLAVCHNENLSHGLHSVVPIWWSLLINSVQHSFPHWLGWQCQWRQQNIFTCFNPSNDHKYLLAERAPIVAYLCVPLPTGVSGYCIGELSSWMRYKNFFEV